MREVQWERMFPDELEKAFQHRPVVYFSYGLCEPHGPHNAIGLDGLKAHAIACETARAFGGIAAPPDFWHIHELGGYALFGTNYVGEVKRKWLTSVPPWVHFKNICYHVRAADVIGFKAAIFITGHYGPNWQDLKTLLELIQPYTKTRLYGLPDFEANLPGFDSDNKSGGDHAGKVETSLLWALEPDLVDFSRLPESVRSAEPVPISQWRDEANPGEKPPREGAAIASRSPYFAVGGNVQLSSRETGERMVQDEVRWIAAKAQELLDAYDPIGGEPGLPTFEAVETFWDQKVRPALPGFKSMSPDFGLGETVNPQSVWFGNWAVPPRY